MRTSYDDDLLMIGALLQFTKQFDTSHQALTEHARWLAVGISEQYGVEPDEGLVRHKTAVICPGSFE